MPASSRLLRLGGAAALIGVAVLALWQAGVLFQSGSTQVTRDGQSVPLEPANASPDTPATGGLAVGLREGDLAPNFEFSSFDGERLKLSDFRGRPVFVNFWASWCGPCKTEMPDIQTTLQRYQDQGLAVLSVNNGETFKPAESFIEQIGVRFTAIAYDPDGVIARRYQVLGMPTSYFIDASGVITRVVPGQLSLKLMDTAVQEAIAGHSARAN